MTRTMYDAVNVDAIPADAEMAAGYVGGSWPTFSRLRARCPNAVLVSIAVNAGQVAQVLDVERGDATPAQVPGWVTWMRQLGYDPSIYCSLSLWAEIVAACQQAGVALPHRWDAHWTGQAHINSGSVATQYESTTGRAGGDVDISLVADFWPGIDGPGSPAQGDDMPRPTDWAFHLDIGGGHFYHFRPDGAGAATPGAPFVNYTALGSDGKWYRYGPGRMGGVFDYPHLPPEARQGDRQFYAYWLG
jgi:hypothetical protein